jgi:hypothetical protein
MKPESAEQEQGIQLFVERRLVFFRPVLMIRLTLPVSYTYLVSILNV